MNESVAYLDASAFVKLVLEEPASQPLRSWLVTRPARTSCAILLAEGMRAVKRTHPDLVARMRQQLSRIDYIPVDDLLLQAAALLDPPELRTLDALHIAAAMRLGDALGAVVTYDARMIEACRSLGLPVAAPA